MAREHQENAYFISTSVSAVIYSGLLLKQINAKNICIVVGTMAKLSLFLANRHSE